MSKKCCFLVLCFCAAILGAEHEEVSDPDPKRWEKAIEQFEKWDSQNSFPCDAVLFVGSSSIRQWATHNYFPELSVINRGFGGSHISDVNFYAERIVLAYKPSVIVFYAGDNDIADGRSPQRVFEDYRKFTRVVHEKLPTTQIIFISIKPSLSRWSFWPLMNEANLLVRDFSAKDKRLYFADAASVLLGSTGKPNTELFMEDNLHLNDKGYEAWTCVLKPVIEQALKSFKGNSQPQSEEHS